MNLSFIVYKYFAKKLPVSYDRFGRLAKKLRYFLTKNFIQECGINVNIEKGATFGSDLIIGENSGIGINAQISSNVKIGRNVMMAPEVLILTSNHNFDSLNKTMIEQGSGETKQVVIEDDVWIGQRTIILPGVTIAKGTVVGAGSVVTKSFPENSVIAGNPAKVIKTRNMEL
jgi:maltose O-acetyltransferase